MSTRRTAAAAFTSTLAVCTILVFVITACGTTKTVASPAATVTVTAPAPAPSTVTATVTPTANSRGQATTISDGVYVIGKDIPAGTWHTPGGQQCYYALLSSDNTSAIITNNISSGPQTLTTSGAHALDVSGGCTWNHD